MSDVRYHGGSKAALTTKRTIQRKGCVTLSTCLQSGDDAMWDIRKIASHILQSGGKEMENQQEAMSTMMMMFERMLQEQRAMSEITAAVKWLLQRNGQFNGKGASRYLRDNKAEMMRCGISEILQVISVNRVAMDELQESIPKIWQQNLT